MVTVSNTMPDVASRACRGTTQRASFQNLSLNVCTSSIQQIEPSAPKSLVYQALFISAAHWHMIWYDKHYD